MVKIGMKKRQLTIIMTVVITLILVGIFINSYFFQKQTEYVEFERFVLDKPFLKITLGENETTEEMFVITNKNGLIDFSVKVNGIEVELTEDEFSLDFDEKKVLDLLIDSSNFVPGVYLGNLEVSAEGDIETIPIILEIQSRNVYFDGNINLFPGGKVAPGQKLNAELKLFDLGRVGRSNVELNYYVMDFLGNVVTFESEEIVIDSRSTITKTIDLPIDLEFGDYVLYTVLIYEDSVGTSSVLFKVAEIEGDETDTSELGLIWIVVSVFGFFLFIIIMLFIYTIFSRDKLLTELQGQYKGELKRQGELVGGQKKIDYVKLKTEPERREYKRAVEEVKKQRINVLKGIQKQRVLKFKKIKKTKNLPTLKKQVSDWKKQGYDTGVLEKKFKLPTVNGVQKKINKWKKQGYDTGVLEKGRKNKGNK